MLLAIDFYIQFLKFNSKVSTKIKKLDQVSKNFRSWAQLRAGPEPLPSRARRGRRAAPRAPAPREGGSAPGLTVWRFGAPPRKSFKYLHRFPNVLANTCIYYLAAVGPSSAVSAQIFASNCACPQRKLCLQD